MNISTSFLSAYQMPADTGKSRYADIKPLITARELQVLHLIAYEHSSKEIAAKLYLSRETINTHRKNIMIKLGVKNTAGMVRVAYQKNILHT